MTASSATNNHNEHGFLAGSFIGRWADRAAKRRQLAGMDRRLLRDIGLTSNDRARECRKPFWKA